MVVPLRKARRGSREKFASKAMRYLKAFVMRHMKADEVLVGSELNEYIWSQGMHNPPRRVQVKSTKKDGKAYVEIATIKPEKWKAFIKTEKDEKGKKKKEEKPKTEKKKPETKKTAKAKPKAKKKETKKKPKKKVKKKPAKKKVTKKKATAKKTAKKPVKKKAPAKKAKKK